MIMCGIFHCNPSESVLEVSCTDNLKWTVFTASQTHTLFFHIWMKISNLYFGVIVILKSVFPWYTIFIWFVLLFNHSVSMSNNEFIDGSKSYNISSICLSFR